MIFTFDIITTGLRGISDYRIKFHKHQPVLCGCKIDNNYTFGDVKRFKNILERSDNIVLMVDSVDVLTLLKQAGVDFKCKLIDLTVMMNLYNENTKQSTLDYYAKYYLDEEHKEVESWLKKQGYNKGDREEADRSYFEKVPTEILESWLSYRLRVIEKLYKFSYPKIKEWGLWKLTKRESELQLCLADMKLEGIKIDRKYFEKLEIELGLKIFDLKYEIYSLFGFGFMIDSNLELGKALTTIGLRPEWNSKTKKYKIGKSELMQWSHPAVELLLKYRYYTKQYSTYVINWLGQLDEDDKIHCDFISTTAKTGRFSSRNPSFQTVEKGGRNDKGFEYDPYVIRRGVIAEDGFYNFYLDFKQMEYRVFAADSKDEYCLQRMKEGEDFHQFVADMVGVTRPQAKDLNFGILYGMGNTALEERLGLKPGGGKAIRNKFEEKLPAMKPYIKNLKSDLKRKGFITNIFGRRCRIPEDGSYRAVNYRVQGGCADIVKFRCMLPIWKLLKPYKSKMNLMVHDELGLKIHKSELHLVKKIKEIMEDQEILIGIRLPVDVEYTKTNWAELEVWNDA